MAKRPTDDGPMIFRSRRYPARGLVGFGVVVAFLALLATVVALVVLLATPARAWVDATSVDGDNLRTPSFNWRVGRIDTPERFAPRCPEERALALAAQARLDQLIAGGVDIVPLLTRRGTLVFDKFGRPVADRVFNRAGQDVAQVLIAERHGRPYDGRSVRLPLEWCPAAPRARALPGYLPDEDD